MKRNELKNLEEKSVADLEKLVAETRVKVTLEEINIRVGKEKNLKKARNLKKNLAQILTLISETKSKEEKKA